MHVGENVLGPFCLKVIVSLRPKAKDQGITWVVVLGFFIWSIYYQLPPLCYPQNVYFLSLFLSFLYLLKAVTHRCHSLELVDLKHELLVGHQSPVPGKVMLGSFYLHRRSGDRRERELLEVVEDVLVEAGVDLAKAGRAEALSAMVELHKPESGRQGWHGLHDEGHVGVLLKPSRGKMIEIKNNQK